ncbi:DUF4369 domain-containing protein [Polaribacter aestuariivivens]|uniref:DUF4369 domain-containing protein n=1 Tax=Polaribacter aestuariivivens TaxID=2304626 RepID=UPI003F494FC3
MKNIFIFFIVLFIIACNEKNENQFTLKGTLKNAENGEVVLLRINNKTVDSTFIKNNKFQFWGTVENPKRAILFIKNSRDYNSLWLENGEIEISGTRGEFKEAKINGSKTQEEQNLLVNNLKEAEYHWNKANNLLMTIPEDDARRDSLITVFDQKSKQKDNIRQEFIKKYPNSFVSLENLSIYKTKWGKPKTEVLFSPMSDAFKNSEKGILIADFLKTATSPKIGEEYIDFAQPNVNGKLVKVSDVLSDFTLVEFWGSNCAPCRVANPKLVKVYKEYHKKGFEIIGVSHDSNKANWLKAIKKDKLPWINVSELKGDDNNGANIYEVNVIPDNILIDKDGIIVARKIPAEKLDYYLKKHLNKNVFKQL